MLTRAQKEEQVAEFKEKFERATCVYLADYRGVDVQSVNQLRSRIHKEGEGHYEYHVAKNSVLKRAAEGPGDPAWVCEACGERAASWASHCGACGTFDGYAWRRPAAWRNRRSRADPPPPR